MLLIIEHHLLIIHDYVLQSKISKLYLIHIQDNQTYLYEYEYCMKNRIDLLSNFLSPLRKYSNIKLAK